MSDLPDDEGVPPGPDGGSGDPGGDAGDDPFAHLTLDESFVAAASLAEPAAEERERAAREANLRRLLEDREVQRANAEYERRRFAGGDDDWAAWDDPDDRRRRPRRGLRIVALVVLVSVVAVYGINHLLAARGPTAATPDPAPTTVLDAPRPAPDDPTVEVIRPDNWPPAAVESSPQPLGSPPPVPDGGGPHAFVRTQPDGVSPVAYDPCRPVHFVTRPGGPPEGDVLIREAVASVSAATGLRFVDDGSTDEAPTDARAAYQPERYGERWAPVLITWSDPVESPRLGEVSVDDPTADPAAYAGSMAVGIDQPDGQGDMVFVTGAVTLDREDLGEALVGVDGRARVRSVIEHELAHLVGLDHVDDPPS